MGRTHVSVTVLTGSACLYFVQDTILNPDPMFPWVKTFLQKILELVHIPLDMIGSPSFTWFLFLSIPLLWIGALMPDIDKDNSTLGRFVPFVESVIGHRTYTHTIWVFGLLSFLTIVFSNIWLGVFTFGYMSHLIQDSFSLSGIDWIYPFKSKKKRKCPFRYRVNGTFETVVFGLSLLLNAYLMFMWVFALNWDILKPITEII